MSDFGNGVNTVTKCRGHSDDDGMWRLHDDNGNADADVDGDDGDGDIIYIFNRNHHFTPIAWKDNVNHENYNFLQI